jgi:hypothetical protein
MPIYNSTNPKPLPPVEYLRERLNYDPKTGALTWKHGPRTKNYLTGKAAGNRDAYYIRVEFEGGRYTAHRIIWKMMTGEDPPSDIDHKDRNGFNNSWANLRVATRTEAVWNRQLPRRRKLPRGVDPSSGGRWRARIMTSQGRKHLGVFATVAEAAAAYEKAAHSLHGEFYVTSTSS